MPRRHSALLVISFVVAVPLCVAACKDAATPTPAGESPSASVGPNPPASRADTGEPAKGPVSASAQAGTPDPLVAPLRKAFRKVLRPSGSRQPSATRWQRAIRTIQTAPSWCRRAAE